MHSCKQATVTAQQPAEQSNYLFKNSQWAVTPDGDLDCEAAAYELSWRNLISTKINWFTHLSQKTWVDADALQEALSVAMPLANAKYLSTFQVIKDFSTNQPKG